MAFNPFHHFRRYSKVVFAILAIICMLTFVLSSGLGGKGDFFTTATDWVTQRRRIPALMTLYGKEYDALQVNQVQFRRRLANEYMELAVGAAQQNLNDRVMNGLSKLDRDVQQEVFQVVIMRSNYLRQGLIDYYVAMLQSALYRIHMLTLRAESQSPKKQEAIDTLSALRDLLSLDGIRFAGRRQGDLYFGGSFKSLDDTLDFLLWLHEADQFGIKLTEEDINFAIRAETLGKLDKAGAEQIYKHLRDQYKTSYSNEVLSAALGDELRVRMAQVALTGSTINGVGTRTHTAIPVFPTPEEYWDLFKDARTTVKVGLIDVPVESFVSQVTTTPNDEELKKFFEKYKNVEAAPERAEPGFKEPRRVQVEWVSASPDLPFYRQAADVLGQVLPGLRLLGYTDPAATLGTPLTLDGEMLYQELDYHRRQIPWTDNFNPHTHATSYLRPETIASLVGAAVSAPNTGGAALSGPLTLEASAFVREVRDRVEVGGAMILTSALNPALLSVLGLPAEAMPRVKLAMIRGMLREKLREGLISGSSLITDDSGLVRNDLRNFRAEVTKKGNEGSDRTAVRKYIDEFVKERGLNHGATSEPRDQYNLVTDPGLAPLRDEYQRRRGTQDVLLRGFANDFFADRDMQTGLPIGTYTPQKFITGAEADVKTPLFWRTEDVPSRTPTFAKARPEVVEAWKRQQARDLAKKEADRLADLAKRDQGDAQKLRDLAAQQGNREYFELGPMARKMPIPAAVGGYGQQYRDPEIPPDKVAYPSDDMLKQLLGLRNDSKGATVIASDLPEKHFYVSSLLQRDGPTPEDFRKVYVNSMARSAEPDALLAELTRDRLIQYRKDVLQQLRAEGKAVINEEGRKRAGEEPTGD